MGRLDGLKQVRLFICLFARSCCFFFFFLTLSFRNVVDLRVRACVCARLNTKLTRTTLVHTVITRVFLYVRVCLVFVVGPRSVLFFIFYFFLFFVEFERS